MATLGCIVLMLLGLAIFASGVVIFASGVVMSMFAHSVSARGFSWAETLTIIAILGLGLFVVFLGGYFLPFHLVPA